MKKLFLLFTMATLVFTSCSKDDENELKGLRGTVWESDENTDNNGVKIEFTGDADCKFIFIENGEDTNVYYRYTYTYPIITFRSINTEDKYADLEGLIDSANNKKDNKMSIKNMETGRTIYTLYRE